MTLYERIEELCGMQGISIRKLEREAGVGQGSVSKWKRGAYRPGSKSVQRIAAYFGVSIDYLMGETDDVISPALIDTLQRHRHDHPDEAADGRATVQVPLLGRVRAGAPAYAAEDILGYEDIPVEWTYLGEHFALRVSGDSMNPRICEGDVLIIRKQSHADSGDIAVVLIGGEEATVKRILLRDDGITLQPFNPAFEPLVFNNKQMRTLPVTILGKVVENRQRY